jgi:hypothetical protein
MALRPGRAGSRSLAALLARAAPFVLGAAAAGIWLRRRQAQLPAAPELAGIAPPPLPDAPDRPRTGRFDRQPTGRFARRPVDIVTVVDDLLGTAS